jgi:hypothetical protein
VTEVDEAETELEPEVAHVAKEIIRRVESKGRQKYKFAVQETDEPELEPEQEVA